MISKIGRKLTSKFVFEYIALISGGLPLFLFSFFSWSLTTYLFQQVYPDIIVSSTSIRTLRCSSLLDEESILVTALRQHFLARQFCIFQLGEQLVIFTRLLENANNLFEFFGL